MSEKQYVLFKLNKEEFGLEISSVREISPYMEITQLPNSPDYIKGIVNFRGKVIPLIDLKKKLNLENTNITQNTRIIIVNINEKESGLIVDEASKISRIHDEDVEVISDIITDVNKKYLTGVAKLENGMVIIIDLESIILS